MIVSLFYSDEFLEFEEMNVMDQILIVNSSKYNTVTEVVLKSWVYTKTCQGEILT